MEPGLEFVGGALALIRAPLVLVCSVLALVGHPVSFVRVTLSLIKLAVPSFQRGGLRTGVLSSVTSPLDNSTRLGGLVASSELLAPASALLS